MNYLKKNNQLPDGWTISNVDQIFAEKIQQRLPDKVFDIHTHLACAEHIKPIPEMLKSGPEKWTTQTWQDHVGFPL